MSWPLGGQGWPDTLLLGPLATRGQQEPWASPSAGQPLMPVAGPATGPSLPASPVGMLQPPVGPQPVEH